MPQIVVRKLSEEVHRALQARAIEHGRSTEAEARDIIAHAVLPDTLVEEERANGWATVRHAGGLHARPCALLANAVKPFSATVTVHARGNSANARSATAMMGLAIAEGEDIEIRAMGKNAGENLKLLRQAKSWDLWIHLKDYPSAYAILQKPKDKNVSDQVLIQASQW